ncbi:hypothetical protein conserved [Leishmania donovani]|uniref:Uncharacterized protein n=3 Tax=Leishmania donovani species complex TaxID=38574 RepID=A4I7P1_LEIIN|nr:conserved hypothetical protein [Leishmania infantum JPCM5]TPP47088.1 hypothetical protein CGC20_33715 [Leishmania donovani]CAC9523658.1 hypothetical_protein_-_conserved [Leishmania infantum]CAJ1991610.1 hypothetical protein conserved [Leishmania donovani]CAM70825.1 conserved hypothetical protein [Leishmania infantum JPCM5]SUZ44642.1 hypothetical_protein_-_conserved [Leishmania infantum]|eukprot:XP_001467760.1 conserved hypothetical protein [Leishmania infantum JPCM5]
MPGASDRGAGYVSCRIHCLPACFSRAVIAVCKLNSPAPDIPPLVSLCRCGLPGYSAREGEVFSAAASGLHPRQQLPFVLSRVAASKAIASLSPDDRAACLKEKDGLTVVFTDRREAAPTLHGCCLSIAHEDSVAASVAWPVLSSDSSSFKDYNAASERLYMGAQLACSHSTLPDATATSFTYAIDVANVAEVHRVRSRFPHLGQRWMPQCTTTASADDVGRALTCVQKQHQECVAAVGAPRDSHGGEGASARQAACRRDEWWKHLATPYVTEADAYAAVVLAQHWGARECAVKLLGIPGRSFAYECVRALPPGGGGAVIMESTPFTASFLVPHTLYSAEVHGAEAATLARQGLHPLLYLYTWTEWVPLNNTVDLPYVVVLACAPCRSGAR